MSRFTGDLFTPPNYPDCDFRVKNPATWNPASFVYTELDSPANAAAVKVNTRILCESGSNIGTHIATSGVSARPDPGFRLTDGLRINVTHAVNSPTYQLSVSGLSSIFELISLPESLTYMTRNP